MTKLTYYWVSSERAVDDKVDILLGLVRECSRRQRSGIKRNMLYGMDCSEINSKADCGTGRSRRMVKVTL